MERYMFALTLFVTMFTIEGHLFSGAHLKKLNFVASNVINGRKTVRVAHRGVLGIESSIDKMGERGLFVREATDGKHLVKLAYSHTNTMITCDLLKDDPEEMLQFVKHFLLRHTVHQSDFEQVNLLHHLGKEGNFTWSTVNEDYLQSKLENSRLIDLKDLMSDCREFYKAEKLKVKVKAITARADRADVVQGRTRQKRGSWLIYPGTKWCGMGSVNVYYDDLGYSRDTDQCCRAHDFCPYSIDGLTWKYNYFNYRLTTLSHCSCDERFRTCLKHQDNPVADNLGDIFFNRLGTKCFNFKERRVCAKGTIWGMCTEYKYVYKVDVRDALKY